MTQDTFWRLLVDWHISRSCVLACIVAACGDVDLPREERSYPEQVLHPHTVVPNKLDGDAEKVMPLDEYNRERSPIRTGVLVDTTQHCFFCEQPGRQLMMVQCVCVAYHWSNEDTMHATVQFDPRFKDKIMQSWIAAMGLDCS